MDLGCSEGQLTRRLSRSSEIDTLVAIDIDTSTLNTAILVIYFLLQNFFQPLQKSLIYERKEDQKAYFYCLSGANAILKDITTYHQIELIALVEVI